MLKRKIALTIATCMVFMALGTSCVKKEKPPVIDASGTAATSQSASPTVSSPTPVTKAETVTQKDVDNQFSAPKTGDTTAIMTTSMGTIKLKLFPEVAPKTVENFVTHSKNGYYNGLKFHRVMNDFMIQGGDPKGNGTGGESIWGKAFADEFSPKRSNYRGALSMANSGANTNGSQFFIVQKKADTKIIEDMKSGKAVSAKSSYSKEEIEKYSKVGGTPWLDLKHTVFGQVYEGMDVVDKIAAVDVGPNDLPKTDVKIVKIEIKIAP